MWSKARIQAVTFGIDRFLVWALVLFLVSYGYIPSKLDRGILVSNYTSVKVESD